MSIPAEFGDGEYPAELENALEPTTSSAPEPSSTGKPDDSSSEGDFEGGNSGFARASFAGTSLAVVFVGTLFVFFA